MKKEVLISNPRSKDYTCGKAVHNVPWLESQCYACTIESQQTEIERLTQELAQAKARFDSLNAAHEALRQRFVRGMRGGDTSLR
jgi:hypothetical protein